MKKKLILFLVFIGLTSCGYESIYTKNKQSKYNTVNKIILDGENRINRKIISILNFDNNKDSIYSVRIDSEKNNTIVAKDSAGNATIYNLQIKIKFSILRNQKIIKTKNFEDSFNYNKSDNNFDLFQYQQNIETNLIQKISEKIIIFLNS